MDKNPSLDVGFVFVDYQDHNLYQLRQWLQPLERLQQSFSVKVFFTSPFVAKELEGSSITGAYFEGQEELIEKLYEFSPKVLLYPNQNLRNFHPLRYPEAVHVFVSHGESDKAYMSQNTIKRYDLYFAAGKAATDRISSKVSNYDSAKRIIEIGRPQTLDSFSLPDGFVTSPKRRVLYAPTWEGVTRATRYTSIISHGRRIVDALLSTGEYQVTYRPHPLSGSRDLAVKRENEAIKKAIRQADRVNGASHFVDESAFGWHLEYHDLLISDISAIAYDWLSTGKPILLTKPVEKKATVEEFPVVDKIYSIKVSDLKVVEKIVREQLEVSPDQKSVASTLNDYYFRQPTSDSDAYFTSAVQAAIGLREKNLSNQNFPRIGSFESRGGKLGILRYPNYGIREALRITGRWSTMRQLEKIDVAEEFYVHLSDPFNGKSALPSVSAALRAHKPGSKMVFVLNQVTTYLLIRGLLKRAEFATLQGDVVLVPVANASDCETIVQKLRPKRVNYLKHHPLNHMLLRLNGFRHVLWKPNLDPLFVPDHSLITYDEIHQPTHGTEDFLKMLLSYSSPKTT